MSSTYYIWSVRGQGWLTDGGTYSSTLKEAKEFDEAEALRRCKVHYRSGMAEYGYIPVSKCDLDIVAGRIVL